MNTPISEIFIRLGWAFLCGFLIFMVPLLIRKSFRAETLWGRIAAGIFALLFFAAFCTGVWILWDKYVPKEEAAEESPLLLEEPVEPSTEFPG